jgi:hypothetical protein
MTQTYYKKDYLPGYTGHVPTSKEIYGRTDGDINKIIAGVLHKPSNFDVDYAVGKPMYA